MESLIDTLVNRLQSILRFSLNFQTFNLRSCILCHLASRKIIWLSILLRVVGVKPIAPNLNHHKGNAVHRIC